MITTRAELVEILKTEPVPSALQMLESEGGSPEDLADAILQARTNYYATLRDAFSEPPE